MLEVTPLALAASKESAVGQLRSLKGHICFDEIDEQAGQVVQEANPHK